MSDQENQSNTTGDTPEQNPLNQPLVVAEDNSGAPMIDDSPKEELPATKEESIDEEATEPAVIKTNAFQEVSIGSDEEIDQSEIVALPSDLDSRVNEVINQSPNVDLLGSPESRHWAQVVSSGLEQNTMSEVFVPSLNEEGSDYRQIPKVNNIPLIGGVPRFKETPGESLRGERAILRMVTHLGLGTIYQTPLWHSGIWVTFKPPGESDLIEIQRQIAAEKIRFGRGSYGLMYSNLTSFLTDKILSIAFAHVFDITTKSEEINLSNLRDHVVCQDIPSFLWGFICTMYPKGFKYERGCIDNPTKCDYVLQEVLNVMKLQWTNMNALTDWQKTFMTGRQTKQKTLAEVKRYQEEMKRMQKYRAVMNEGERDEIAINIKTPSITQYIESGHRWISGIVENVDRAMGVDPDQKERNSTVELHGKATALRQYTHWIESIEVNGNIVEDLETIETTLNTFSTNDRIYEFILSSVLNYINNSTMSVIGIPVYHCPKCGKEQEGKKELPHHTNIIPIDVVQVFFELISQRLRKIQTR